MHVAGHAPVVHLHEHQHDLNMFCGNQIILTDSTAQFQALEQNRGVINMHHMALTEGPHFTCLVSSKVVK